MNDHPLCDTFDQMLREELPNLFRLHINPHVVQVCLCLERYVQTTWNDPTAPGPAARHQTFLANSFDEALGGAIKLARYDRNLAGMAALGLIIDPAGRLGPFASARAAGGATVEFLPGLRVVGPGQDLLDVAMPGLAAPASRSDGARFGLITIIPDPQGGIGVAEEELRRFTTPGSPDAPLVITCLSRSSLAAIRRGNASAARGLIPDIVVFDDSFTDRHVPFGAFTAGAALYKHWNQPGKTTFHSTTYQPNTISSLHFTRCLESADPQFRASLAQDLQRIVRDRDFRGALFRRLYSRSLYNATRAAGFDVEPIRASGDFIHAGDRKVFDGVSGVACSVRGHNPPGYGREIAKLADLADPAAELTSRLNSLTGLENALPAVSGACAVENGLKLALVAQFPRRHVLALKSGFGGKTLFALTATWKPFYKEHIDPLYADVSHVDPFAPDAKQQIEAVLREHDVAVVHLELIQGVGGVRQVPDAVVQLLDTGRQRWGYLLLVDEVQTGVYRTGPFTRCGAMSLKPDLLVVGKGTSDMMFPFAMLMYSAAVKDRLSAAESDLPDAIRERYGYEYGYKTALNVLRQADSLRLTKRVTETGDLFGRLLTQGLASCKAVREVRVFGLLIGIELEAARPPQRWLRQRLFQFYVLAMLRHERCPVLVGFCQYEPNVLKITPPLTVEAAVVREVSATIVEVIRKPFYRLAAADMVNLIKLKLSKRRPRNDNNDGYASSSSSTRPHVPAHEPLAR
jgi:acetylornithine/succinyldiaminopimelate/putrescine aminotransferase